MFSLLDLNRWVILVLMIFGLGTNVINIFAFTRPVFNHHVCSWYFITLSLNNFIYSAIVLLDRFLLIESISFCRAVAFLDTFTRGFAHYLILLAAIDRYCATSTNVQRRKFNSFQVIPWAIGSIFIGCLLFAIGAPILIDFTMNVVFIYSIMQLVLSVLLPLLSMIVVAFFTLKNHRLMGELPATVSRCRRMEYHLTGTILFLVPLHFILNLAEIFQWFWINFGLNVPPMDLVDLFVRWPIYFSHLSPMICYLIQSREYRRELNRILPVRRPQIESLPSLTI